MSTNVSFPTIKDRVNRVQQIIPLDEQESKPGWLSILEDIFGVTDDEEGISLLNAYTTTEEFLYNELLLCDRTKDKPKLKLKAIATVLKGFDPFNKEPDKKDIKEENADEGANMKISDHILALKSPKQMKDRELLVLFDKDNEYEIEQELIKRSSGQAFVVLKEDSTEEDIKIDIEASLELLKLSRKRTNPTIIPHPTDPGKVVQVYHIGQLHMEENIIELCPFCDEVMFKGYCQECNCNFSGIAEKERAYMRLVSEHDNFNTESFSDRRALMVSGQKGLEDLRKTWPSVSIKFRELDMLNDLPKLRKIRKLPSARVADPFNVRK